MKITVHHKAFGDDRAVAELDLPDAKDYAELMNRLDEAFELTNTIHAPWFLNKDARLRMLVKGGVRSTSVGDILEVAGAASGLSSWKVAPFGFDQITTAHVLNGKGGINA